ncbi:MAG: hypothetical protein OXG35_09555 [Acidobacteria bacterium]|nr:hypothetical protein [Acidobacteriota bacterium]
MMLTRAVGPINMTVCDMSFRDNNGFTSFGDMFGFDLQRDATRLVPPRGDGGILGAAARAASLAMVGMAV